jgi:hypothetical protein
MTPEEIERANRSAPSMPGEPDQVIYGADKIAERERARALGLTGQRTYSSDEAAREEQFARENDGAYYDRVTGSTFRVGGKRGMGYRNPGSADYGGSGGVEFYSNVADGMAARNNQRALQNQSGMARSSANASNRRGEMVQMDQGGLAANEMGRNAQLQAMDMQRSAAMGEAPSAADYQTRLAMDSGMGQQSAAMGSARGLAGLSGAQGQSAAMAQSAGNAGAAGGLARSKEMATNLGMYSSAADNMRSGDISTLGLSNQNQLFNKNLNDQWQVGNANLLASQANLGNAYSDSDIDWQEEKNRIASKQFEYDQRMAAGEAGAEMDAAGARIAAARESRDNKRKLAAGIGTAAGTALGSFGGPGGMALGGVGGGLLGSKIGEGF